MLLNREQLRINGTQDKCHHKLLLTVWEPIRWLLLLLHAGVLLQKPIMQWKFLIRATEISNYPMYLLRAVRWVIMIISRGLLSEPTVPSLLKYSTAGASWCLNQQTNTSNGMATISRESHAREVFTTMWVILRTLRIRAPYMDL